MITQYMMWENGVDLVAMYNNSSQPNLIIHVAGRVNTPVGSAPAGMILLQPDLAAAPELMGFISSDPDVAAYFGPNIFSGTPFENAPALSADITINSNNTDVTTRIKVGGRIIELKLSGLGQLTHYNREPMETAPFNQDVLEADAKAANLSIDGEPVSLTFPSQSITGGHAAVSSPAGIYSR